MSTALNYINKNISIIDPRGTEKNMSIPPTRSLAFSSSPSTAFFLVKNVEKPPNGFHIPPNNNHPQIIRTTHRVLATTTIVSCSRPDTEMDKVGDSSETDLFLSSTLEIGSNPEESDPESSYGLWDSVLLVSPFFFWGTAMVAMKEVLPKAGPFFVAAFRLIPAGALLIGFAMFRGRRQPSGIAAWVSIFLFGAVDAACFQGFLAQGLQKTSAGLGSVIIDSQPLTVAILAALLFGESIGVVGAAGLVVGVIGLLLLEVPSLSLEGANSTLWGSGEWWMLLAAQSMAVGTVMVRWVTKYSDPVMATGWHMVIGGLPLLAISVLNHDPAISGSLKDLTSSDLLALLYTSLFGSAISYGVYFYNATRGSYISGRHSHPCSWLGP
ncbi:nodulin MtN21 /EamA-like transporter family protein isoform X2 [Tasmannia lanceolata]|uniref:nodulin MtN21 /EamA-like transporter family protein isoform X2 n=1 Tax=Tasmannia lanceolata TaxID=3420 RepID=UPI0040648FEE